MSSFRDPGFNAMVEWLGCVADRDSTLRSAGRSELAVGFAGIVGESHGGLTRPACVRVEELYEQGTEIRNTRQLSIVSAEELKLIAIDMGMDEVTPDLLGANIVLKGIPDFTLVPPCSRIQFEHGVTLVIDLENLPCNLPAREIEKEMPGFGRKFKSSAKNRRGVTAWVESEGTVKTGESVRLFVPVQPPWPHDHGPVSDHVS